MSQRVTREDIEDILEAFGNSHFAHLELTVGSVRIAVNRGAAAAEQRPILSPPAIVAVTAPLIGAFQAGFEPGTPALVHVGSRVEDDTTVGFIRAMQKLTAVEAGVSGTVVDVAVEDGRFVEFGQTIIRVSLDDDRGTA